MTTDYETNSAGSALKMVIGQTEYQLARHSLDDISHQKASMNRIMATFMMGGGRSQWAAIAQLYEETAGEAGCPVAHITEIYVYEDGSAIAIISVPESGGMVQ